MLCGICSTELALTWTEIAPRHDKYVPSYSTQIHEKNYETTPYDEKY